HYLIWTVSVTSFGRFLLPHLDGFCYLIWTVSVTSFGRFLLPHLDGFCYLIWHGATRGSVIPGSIDTKLIERKIPFGDDPSKSCKGMYVIAADPLDKQIVLGECKWRNSFNETEAIERLRRRAGLIHGYPADNAYFSLFSKNKSSDATLARYDHDEHMTCLFVDNLYAAA
ncbi:hypothetical protein JS533_007705, partial [Bifidobacterium amazonense]